MHIRHIRLALAIALVAVAGCSEHSTAISDDTTTATTTTSSGCALFTAGQVAAGLSGTSVCVAASTAAAEYALIPFNGSISSASASFQVVSVGASAASASPSIIPTTSASLDLLLASPTFSATPLTVNRSFEDGLRSRERKTLPSLINGARTWMRRSTSQRAALDAIPSSVEVGQLLRLNANADEACAAPSYRYGRIVAITNRAVVVADTGNPSGGYSDAEYASLGTTFDTLVDPLDRGAFGDPSDIDRNGRVVLFFTKTVNDLTPKSSTSYIGGFFYARDLFPAQATTDFPACAGSNVGEMFYVMVPDPTRGGAFSKANVAGEVLGTVAHEYQHLINASRRMYVNTNSEDFEETWLDEGLAHTAEELLFYRVAGLQPRQNLDATTIRGSATRVNAFNAYQSSNFGRYDEYLGAVSRFSPYADNDSLATRGATWAFLRYAVDHAATSDGDLWHRLVNSTTTGLGTLQSVFGSTVLTMIRDWQTSVLTDDVAGVAATYQQQSWNYRSMFAALLNTSVFPLADASLAAGSHTVSLTRGASAYLRFAVAAGESATIQWAGAPADVQFTIVRTK